MLVYIDLGKSTDINFKFMVIGQGLGKFRIQAMDSLNNQNIFSPQFLWLSRIFFFPDLKIKVGNYNFFSIQKFLHLLTKKLHVHRFQTLEIIFSVFILRRLFSLFKVIIYRNGMWMESIGPKLDGQPMGKCGLSGRRRSGDQYKFDPGIFCDPAGNLCDLFFLHGFLHQGHLLGASCRHHIIQIPYCSDSLQVTPV